MLQTAGRADVCIRIQWYVLRVPFSFLFFVVSFGVWALGSCAERERSKSAIHMTVCSLKRDRAHLRHARCNAPLGVCCFFRVCPPAAACSRLLQARFLFSIFFSACLSTLLLFCWRSAALVLPKHTHIQSYSTCHPVIWI